MGPWVVHMPEEGVLHSSETLHCLLVMWTCFIKNKKSVFYSGRSLPLVVVSHMDSRSFYSWILLNSLLCLKTLTLFLRDLLSLRLNKDQFILFPGQTFLFSVLWEHLPHPTLDLVSFHDILSVEHSGYPSWWVCFLVSCCPSHTVDWRPAGLSQIWLLRCLVLITLGHQ